MNTYLIAILLSLGAGALYASFAQGLLLTYRSTGVVNFAHGGIALLGAYTYAELRQTGRLVVPPLPNPLALVESAARLGGWQLDLPDIPTFISFGAPLKFLPAFLAALTIGAVTGVAIYLLVFRPMRSHPALARVVASVGLMLTFQAVVVLRFGTEPRSVGRILPHGTVSVFGQSTAVDRLYLAAIGLTGSLLLALVYRFTKFGWATEAAAESEKGAILSGLATDKLAIVNWLIAGVTAVLMGVLFSTLTALSPDAFILFVIPALAAVLLAGMRSFVVAGLAGFLVAALQAVAAPLARDVSWIPAVGMADALPLLVIIITMMVRGSRIPMRGGIVTEALPRAPRPRRGAVRITAIAAVAAVCVIWAPYGYRAAIISSAIGTIVAVSIVILVGLVGQISLMQMAVAGISALAMTRLTTTWGVPFPVAPLIAALVAMVLSLVAAFPSLRIRGTHLAIVTLAAAYAFDALILRNGEILNAATSRVDPPQLFGVNLGVNGSFPIGSDGSPNPAFGLLAVAVAAGSCAVLYQVRRGAFGQRLLAVRSNERAAAAVGIDVARTKLQAFALAGFIAGLAGAMGAYQFESVSQPTYGTFTSLSALAFVYLAGVSSLGGAFTAGLIAVGGIMNHIVLTEMLNMPSYEVLIGGVGLVFASIRHPDGIAGEAVHAAHVISARRAARRAPRRAATTLPEGAYDAVA